LTIYPYCDINCPYSPYFPPRVEIRKKWGQLSGLVAQIFTSPPSNERVCKLQDNLDMRGGGMIEVSVKQREYMPLSEYLKILYSTGCPPV